jgi:hypothetical protein
MFGIFEVPGPTAAQIAADWPFCEFYITDDEFSLVYSQWVNWLEVNCQGGHAMTVGSSSWATDKRFHRVFFEDSTELAMFKLRFG